MLEKLITDLKKNLPAPLKKMLGGEEVSEEAKETSTEEDTQEENSSGGEDAKKKKTSMIIRVIVILALGYFAVDEFLLKEEVPQVSGAGAGVGAEDKLAAKRKARKKKLEEAKAKAEAEAKAKENANTNVASGADVTSEQTAPTVTTETNMATKEEAPPATETTPPVENINVTPKEEVVSSEIVKPEALDDKLDKLNEAIPPVAESNTNIATNTAVEEIKIPSVGEEVPKKEETKEEPKENKMTSKIVDEIVETPPPNYEQTGRGLVYNCKDKFWACVDKPAYITCNKNMKYNQKNGKSLECSTVAIYANDEDCEKIQKYNVSVNQPTTFCGP